MAWSSDITSGKTHYADNGGGDPANMPDDNLSTYVQNFHYIAIDLGSGNQKDVTKLTLAVLNSSARSAFLATLPALQGSNNSTNGSDGDWSEVYQFLSGDVLTPGAYPGIIIDKEFSNGTAYRWYRLYNCFYTSSPNNVVYTEWEMFYEFIIRLFSTSISINSISENINLLGGEIDSGTSDDITISDSIDAWHNAGYVTDDLTVSDLIDVESESQKGTSENLTISDFINGQKFTDTANNEFTIDDFMDFFIEFDTPTDVNNIGISDSIDCLNWSEWLRNNGAISLKRFYFTLTGAADGETDIEIPISSFQARKRDGEATYLSVTIPGMAYAGQIADRSNGQMIIDIAYIVNGVEEIREEILRVNLETIRVDEGARSRSINLTGHRSETFDGRVKDLSNPIYKYTINGKIRYRFAVVDPYLNPGDTCRVGSDEFRVDYITYAISGNYRQMEVYEV